MSINEAIKLLNKWNPLYLPKWCNEYENHFVFIKDEDAIEPGVVVDKKSKKVAVFSPSLIPIEEIRKGAKKYHLNY